MRLKFSFLSLMLILLTSLGVRAAILIEDPSEPKKKVKHIVKTASDGVTLRSLRRVGIGGTAQGPLGLLGIQMELNFSKNWGFIIGYGGGKGFSSTTLQAKKVFSGEWLIPYLTVGYSRFYTVRDDVVTKTTPTYILDKLAKPEERTAGRFDIHAVFPAFGLQYVQLNGEYAGFSVFAEAVVLANLETFATAPTGTVGMIYYF